MAASDGFRTRALAATVVDRVVHGGCTLEVALAATLPAEPARGAGQVAADPTRHHPEGAFSERGQVQAYAFGAVRWHHRHQALLAKLLDKPLRSRDRIIESLLSVGLFQLRSAGQPAYAVVSATVGAARLLGRPRATGLVNAALRRFVREHSVLESSLARHPDAWFSHPAWLIDALQHDWPDDWTGILEANQRHPPFWLRLNGRRIRPADFRQRLAGETGVGADPLDGVPTALRLERPLPVQRLPGFGEGLISVQDAGAQIAAPLLLDGLPDSDETLPPRILDACAAPGGKLMHLLELAGDCLDATALDVSGDRLGRLRENLARLGLAANVIEGDGTTPDSWWDGRAFSRILVDAPCSGTGVIRRHPDIKVLRRPDDIAALADRQRSLLEALWPLLQPGGRLLYVTCSVLHQENAQVGGSFLAAHSDAREIPLGDHLPPGMNGVAASPGIQLLPTGDTDGFYYVLMERVPR